MTPRPALLASALAAGLALTGCTEQPATADGATRLQAVDVGEDGLLAEGDRPPAPTLSGTTLEGGPLDVSDYRGQVVVLNFWASWCPPCRVEAPSLVEVAQQTADEGVQFVGVNVRDARDEAIAFEWEAGVPYPSLHDPSGALLGRFRRTVPPFPPATVVLDRRGRVAARFLGAVTTRQLLEPVQALVTETA